MTWVITNADLDTGGTITLESPITDNTPNCNQCTDGCSSCPVDGACGVHNGIYASEASSHVWGTFVCGDANHVGYLCQMSSDHSTTISGYSGSFYECQPHQTFACGHIDLISNSSLHTIQASCTTTNANGQSCTVTGFYPCSFHTHIYPEPE